MPDATRDRSGALPAGRVVRVLKDGYWDRTEIVELEDGSRRVRKSSKGDAPPGPWGIEALRREIDYLANLPASAEGVFPPLLRTWDDDGARPPRVGYEVSFYADHIDTGKLARARALPQREIDAFQDALAEALLDRVHVPVAPSEPLLSRHVVAVVEQSLHALAQDPALARLINGQEIQLNDRKVAGTRAAFLQLVAAGDALATLDAEPQVRLHGDCFLENILWRPEGSAVTMPAPQLVLVDPVSVAGISAGPPVFDLVKYSSYATGELPALRSEWVEVGGFEGGEGFRYCIRWEDAALVPFRENDWQTRLRRAFELKYGGVDERTYRLIDGYFSVAMAVNTKGVQRRARLLKATIDFNAAARGAGG